MKKKIEELFFKFVEMGIITGFVIGIIIAIIYFIKMIIKMLSSIMSLVKVLHNSSFEVIVKVLGITLGVILLFILIEKFWDSRDDLFHFLVFMICAPFDYLGKIRNKELINYRNEVKELLSYIVNFSNMDFENIPESEFWSFVERAVKQNERLEKNRKLLESKNLKISLGVELIFLVFGVIVALFL